ncbi:MAG: SIMPL domain-containing protein [Candidatus Gracilibacteria bacterium]|jgi:uncharacterized protein YggE|nr:SIMPL domain-containing protein [Candidatus Gracilibacteria bacterium]
MKKEITIIAATAVVCATLFGLSTNIKETGITIKNTASNEQNSISVTGDGKVTATPDTVHINVGVSELGKTTKEAQEKANQKLNQILESLKEFNIPKSNIQTDNISFRPEYEWQEDNKRVLIGQRVSQNLNIKIPGIDKDAEKTSKIIDSLGKIDGIELGSIRFDIEEKKAFFTKAREQAFQKAEQKAKELAKLGKVELLKPVHISESTFDYNPPIYRNFAKMEASMDMDGSGSSVPAGELEISANVSVIFEIK